MAKQANQKRISNGKEGTSFEENNVFDDSLLPAADELSKMDQVSKDIIPWIMKRTEVEQDARISFNNKRIGLAEKEINSVCRYNFTALIFAFIIIMSGIFFSAFLVINNLKVEGTIFGGATIVFAATTLVRSSRKDKK